MIEHPIFQVVSRPSLTSGCAGSPPQLRVRQRRTSPLLIWKVSTYEQARSQSIRGSGLSHLARLALSVECARNNLPLHQDLHSCSRYICLLHDWVVAISDRESVPTLLQATQVAFQVSVLLDSLAPSVFSDMLALLPWMASAASRAHTSHHLHDLYVHLPILSSSTGSDSRDYELEYCACWRSLCFRHFLVVCERQENVRWA